MLVLLHAEGPASAARVAPPGRTAVCGECPSVGLTPGTHAVETTEIDELPNGAHCVELCRFRMLLAEEIFDSGEDRPR